MSPNPVVPTVSLHIYILKYTAASIALSVTELFNSSLKLGSVPQHGKKLVLRQFPKSKCLNLITYRPISLMISLKP